MINRCLRPWAFAFYGLTTTCLLAWSGSAFAQENLTFAEILDQGNQQLEQEDFEAASKTFSLAIEASKTGLDPRGYLGRAKANAGLEDYQAALADFKSAEDQSLGVPNAELLYARGTMYLDIGPQAYGLALPDLQAAYEEDRSNNDYLFSLGKVYGQLSATTPGAADEAKDLLTKYLENDPDNAEAFRLRGKAVAVLQDFDDALADLDRAIEIDPEDHETHATLGFIYLQQKEYEKAVEALDQSIEKYTPKDEETKMPYSEAYLTKAAALEELGKRSNDLAQSQAAYQQQIETCNTLIDLLPDDQAGDAVKIAAMYRRGVGQRLLEQFGAAVQSFTEAIDLNPEMGEAYFRRAICFNEMGEEKLALGDLQAAQSLNFEDSRAYLWEGLTYAQMGEYRKAIRSYNEAISYSNRYTDAFLNRGHAYFNLEDYESAIDSFNECIRLQPTEASHYYKRGICFRNLDDNEQAVRSCMNAIQFEAHFLPAYDLLIPILEADGRRELANQYRQKREEIRGQAGQ